MRLFSDVTSGIDDPFLAHAARLAVRGTGRTWPNPSVGCVIVRDGRVVGEGFHPRAGLAHAEVFALADAGEAARGSDVYVTLEPCSHHGKTPPCVDALIAAGVSRVVVGIADPNPEAGGGSKRLTAAGIRVDFAADPEPFAELNRGWITRVVSGLPHVTVKSALSLDAKVAFAAGERASITGDAGGAITQRLRRQADAVLVSAATIAADDPALTVRSGADGRVEPQPLRVVLARSLIAPGDARVFTDEAAPTLVLASELVDRHWLDVLPSHVEVARFASDEGLVGVLASLADRGVGELLVEPGSRLMSALWAERLIDRFVCVSAGGMAGPGLPLYEGAADRDGDSLVHRLQPVEVGIVGDVSVTVWDAHALHDAT